MQGKKWESLLEHTGWDPRSGGMVREDLSVNGALLLSCKHREALTYGKSKERAL